MSTKVIIYRIIGIIILIALLFKPISFILNELIYPIVYLAIIIGILLAVSWVIFNIKTNLPEFDSKPKNKYRGYKITDIHRDDYDDFIEDEYDIDEFEEDEYEEDEYEEDDFADEDEYDYDDNEYDEDDYDEDYDDQDDED